jgi:hypothetical protein
MSARGAALLGGVLLLAGCTSHETHPATARSPMPPRAYSSSAVRAVCAAALPGEVVVAAARGTVAGVRSFTFGPSFQPTMPDAFPGAAPGAPATWCCARNSTSSLTAWVVGPDTTTAVKVVTLNGSVPTSPHCPPISL